jgi:hypothetical protein
MSKKLRRLLSKRAIVGYFLFLAVILNQGIGLMSNVDFVLVAPDNPRLLQFWTFLVSPKGNLVAILLAIVYLTGLAFWPEKESEKQEEREIEGTMPPQGVQNVALNAPTAPTVPPGYALIKLEPNIVPQISHCKVIDVYEDKDGVIVEGTRKGGFKALVMPYRNMSSPVKPKDAAVPIGLSGEIATEMSFKCFEVNSLVRVHPGVCLNEQNTKMIFAEEEERPVVVATIEKGKINAVERQITTRFVNGRTHRKPLTGNIIGLTIRLLHSKTKSTSYVLIVDNESDLKLEVLSHWRLMESMQYRIQGLRWANELYEPPGCYLAYEERVRDWQDRVSIFLERFVSVDAGKEFRESKPKLDDALSGKAPPDSNKWAQLLDKPNTWSLQGYLESRVGILERLEKTPSPNF